MVSSNIRQVAWYADGSNLPMPAVVRGSVDSVENSIESQTEDESIAALDKPSYSNIDDVEIYPTRHAEKMTQLEGQAVGSFI